MPFTIPPDGFRHVPEKRSLAFPYLRHTPPSAFVPVVPPSDTELAYALPILDRQELAVYQRLFAVGLTCPGWAEATTPFTVQRSVRHRHCIEVAPTGLPQYAFYVRTAEEIAQVAANATLLLRALHHETPLVDCRACCPLAVIRPCVCVISFTCPIHAGPQCHGSHD